MRADKYILPFLRAKIADVNVSREVSISLIKTGGLSVNGKTILKPSFDITVADGIVIDFELLNHILFPQKFIKSTLDKRNVNVIFENEYFIVVNKEVGVVVHPGAGVYSDTLIQNVFPDIGYSNTYNYRDLGVVHRLDKETSGIIILSKNRLVTNYLASLFEKRKVKKYYLALSVLSDSCKKNIDLSEVKHISNIEDYFYRITRIESVGELFNDPDVPDNFNTSEGIKKLERDWYLVNGFIYKKNRNSFRFVLNPDALPSGVKSKTAVMKLKPLCIDDKKVLFIIRLITGRTHQIRATLYELGMPILNDSLYFNRKLIKDTDIISDRMYLHAFAVFFDIPYEYFDGKDKKIKNNR